MRNLEDGCREAGSQEFSELLVKPLDSFRAHTSADSRAGSNAATPCLGCIRHRDIIGERLEVTVPRFAKITKPERMNTQPATHPPIGVVMLDEFLCRADHVAGERNPVEVCDEHDAIRFEHPRGLDSCAGTVEPMPALTRGNNVECSVWKAGVLRASYVVLHADTGARVELACGSEEPFSRINANHTGAAAGEPTGEAPCTRTEVNDRLTIRAYSVRCESLEQRIGEARSMAGIVL